MKKLNRTDIRHHFLYCALWTEELEMKCDTDDFDQTALDRADIIINRFLELALEYDLAVYAEHFKSDTESQLGHDLWLSMNDHGAGFFDHMLGGVETRLQDICRQMRWNEKGDFHINMVWVDKSGKIFIE